MDWMTLVCLRSPESGPFPSELIGHTPPSPQAAQLGQGPSPCGPFPTRLGRREKGEVVEAPCSSSLLGPGWGTWQLRMWLQQPAPGASRNPPNRQLTLFIRVADQALSKC